MNDDIIKKLQEYTNRKVGYVQKEKTATAPYTNAKPPMFNTMIKWQIPIELCPHCLARLKGAEPQIFSAWTNTAAGQKVKKKPTKVVKEAKLSEVEEI